MVGQVWQRHSELFLRSGEAIACNHAVAVNKATINHYFEVTFQKNGPLDRPSLIFNADESGMLLSPSPGKWVQCMTLGVKTQVTVLCCVVQQGVPFLPWSFSAQELT